ncbi:hypothetical protein CMESO_118 (nucleomorph) [Chroomonas mesostigmatica CCMP1168]|uniref:Uncharacterized protein n=1 Tax=Chroomonas mesostigmatica CCMP1168 TaxID=1195612 RepID=J7G2R2_9CRYP|nr:hypothetical protein CMESO_118 [Chroomonas mesostigmatica CCMP1168]
MKKKLKKKISSFIFFFKESFFKYKYLKIQKKFLKALTKFFPVFFLKWKVDIYLPKIFSKSFSLNFGLFSFLKNLKKKKKNMFSFELFSLFLKKQLSKKLKEKTKNQNENFIRLDIFFPKESDLSHYLNKIKKYFK